MTNLYYIDYLSPIGTIRLVASDLALHGTWFHGSRHFLANFNQDHLQCQYTSNRVERGHCPQSSRCTVRTGLVYGATSL